MDIKPDYEQDNLKLYNADCMDIMKQYPDDYFDLAVVDPPYGINAGKMTMGSGKHKFKNWDISTPKEDYFIELFRVSKNQIIWGANYMCNYLPITSSWIYWDKMQDGFGTFSTGELAWSSHKKPMKQIRYKWQGNYCGFERAITTKSSNGMNKIHPTQKPVKLYNWIYANYAEPGQRILDTHLGSGSNAISAHYAKMGEFVGCELDEDYFKASVDHIYKETRQMDLF